MKTHLLLHLRYRYRALEQNVAPMGAAEVLSPRAGGPGHRVGGSVAVLSKDAMVILVDARWFRWGCGVSRDVAVVGTCVLGLARLPRPDAA